MAFSEIGRVKRPRHSGPVKWPKATQKSQLQSDLAGFCPGAKNQISRKFNWAFKDAQTRQCGGGRTKGPSMGPCPCSSWKRTTGSIPMPNSNCSVRGMRLPMRALPSWIYPTVCVCHSILKLQDSARTQSWRTSCYRGCRHGLGMIGSSGWGLSPSNECPKCNRILPLCNLTIFLVYTWWSSHRAPIFLPKAVSSLSAGLALAKNKIVEQDLRQLRFRALARIYLKSFSLFLNHFLFIFKTGFMKIYIKIMEIFILLMVSTYNYDKNKCCMYSLWVVLS